MHLLRRIVLTLLINIAAIAIAAALIPGISYQYGLNGLLAIAIIMGAVNLLIKPFLKLLALPIEIATIGVCTIVINTILLLIVDHLLPEFSLHGFPFPGFTFQSFLIPPFMLPTWGTALVSSIVIGLIITLLSWLTKGK